MKNLEKYLTLLDGEVDGLEKYDERKYGKTYITFFRLKKD